MVVKVWSNPNLQLYVVKAYLREGIKKAEFSLLKREVPSPYSL